MPNTSETLNLLRQLAANPPQDEAERRQIAAAAYDLARAVEPLYDQTQRLIYSHTVVPLMDTANDLRLFAILSNPVGNARSTTELAERTGADPKLLIRILRFLAAYKLIDQPEVDQWAGSALTKELSQEGNHSGMKHHVYTCGVAFDAMPSFLARNNYQQVEDLKDCPLQQGFNTKGSLFDWYQDHPDNLGYFMNWLSKHRGKTTWLESGLVGELAAKQDDEDTTLFVDVGGNVGNICVDLRKKLPSLKGRVFNQDLPHVVANTIGHPGVEQSPADFWVEQPIKGARVYYMRNILHDYSDSRALKILKNVLPAMDSNSEIWIDELVVPDIGATQAQANWDLTMLTCVAGMERSRSQWVELLDEAGLTIRKLWTVDAGRGESVIVAVPNVQ